MIIINFNYIRMIIKIGKLMKQINSDISYVMFDKKSSWLKVNTFIGDIK